MKCPTCPDSTLVMTERQGVEIDYCPACRGVWLDRGELEKLIAGAQAEVQPFAYPRDPTFSPAAPPQNYPPPPYPANSGWRRDDDDDRYDRQGHPRRKRGFDLFDIFD